MYHVSLNLTASQVKELKTLAVARDKTVKDLVTELVVRELGAEAKT